MIKKIIRNVLHPDLFEKIKRSFKKDYSVIRKEEDRINKLSRYTIAETDFYNRRIKIADNASFSFMKKEIFGLQIYKFNSEKKDPVIIDCGANIGLSVIYFKTLFPEATVTAFEPDHNIYEILKYNITAFGFDKVYLHNKACWNEDTVLSFFSEGADGGRNATSADHEKLINVNAIRLSDYIIGPVDFLKMDIEGAETEVIYDLKDVLKNVQNIFIEVHSYTGQEQKLPEILTILKNAGFRLHISAPGLTSQNPFIQLNSYAGMDNQVNVFGIRTPKSE